MATTWEQINIYVGTKFGEEITNNHHHHLVCTSCGSVSDVTLSAAAERSLDKALRED